MRLVVVLLIVLLAACEEVTPTLVMPTRAQLPSQTPAPPTATATPDVPTLEDIILTVSLERSILPGDGRSTVLVTAQIAAPPEIEPRIAGLPVFFRADGGGGFPESSMALTQNSAQSTYVAGFSDGVRPVVITALLDVPELGRVSGTATLELHREELALALPCAFAVPMGAFAAPLSFDLLTNRLDLPGEYVVRLNVDAGAISTDPTTMGSSFASLAARSGQGVQFYFTPPPDPPTGSATLCASIADRDSLPAVCVPVIWDTPISDFDFNWTRISETAYLNSTLSEVRLMASAPVPTTTLAAFGYEVVASEGPMPDPNYLTNVETGTALPVGQCSLLELSNAGVVYNGYAPKPQAAVLRWQVVAPGVNEAVTFDAYTVVASQPLELVDAGAQIQLADGAAIGFMPQAFDANFRLYATAPFDPAASTTRVLFRIYVPAEFTDPVPSMLQAAASAEVVFAPTIVEADTEATEETTSLLTIPGLTGVNVLPPPNNEWINLRINLQSSRLSVHYISTELVSLVNPITNEESGWRVVYMFGDVPTNAVRVAPTL